jgi:hypothetical protein
MDQDHFKDDGTRASGSVKEAIGQVTGNADPDRGRGPGVGGPSAEGRGLRQQQGSHGPHE